VHAASQVPTSSGYDLCQPDTDRPVIGQLLAQLASWAKNSRTQWSQKKPGQMHFL